MYGCYLVLVTLEKADGTRDVVHAVYGRPLLDHLVIGFASIWGQQGVQISRLKLVGLCHQGCQIAHPISSVTPLPRKVGMCCCYCYQI